MEDMLEKILEFGNFRRELRRTIHKVEPKVINYYIDYWNRNILDDNRELLYCYDIESGKYIAIDNTSNDCWVEEFGSEEDCLFWLKESIDN